MSCRFLGFSEGFLFFSFRNCDSLVIVGAFSLEFAQIYLALLVWCGGELASPDFYSRAHLFFWEVRACLNKVSGKVFLSLQTIIEGDHLDWLSFSQLIWSLALQLGRW